MLTTFWLRLGSWLGKLLLIVITLGLLGWALATAWFAWQHRGPVSALEQIPDGEAAMTQDVIQTAVRIVDEHREIRSLAVEAFTQGLEQPQRMHGMVGQPDGGFLGFVRGIRDAGPLGIESGHQQRVHLLGRQLQP